MKLPCLPAIERPQGIGLHILVIEIHHPGDPDVLLHPRIFDRAD